MNNRRRIGFAPAGPRSWNGRRPREFLSWERSWPGVLCACSATLAGCGNVAEAFPTSVSGALVFVLVAAAALAMTRNLGKDTRTPLAGGNSLDCRAFDSSPDGFCVLRPLRDSAGAVEDFVWEYANPAAERMAKTGPLRGRRLLEVLSGRAPAVLLDRGTRVLETRLAEETEVHYESDEINGWFRLVLIPCGDSLAVSISDVTARRGIEEALRRSETQFRAAQDLSLEAFTVLRAVRDPSGKISDFEWQYANAQAHHILRRENLVGKRLLEVLPGNVEHSDLFARYVRIVESGEPMDLEQFYDADGIAGWFRHIAVKLNDGIAAYFRDTTEQKRLEEALRDSEARYRTLVERIPGIVYAASLEDFLKTTYVSPQIERFTGMSPEEWLARPDAWVRHVHPDDRETVIQTGIEAARQGQPVSLDYRIVAPDGSIHWVHDEAVPLLDDQGKVMSYHGLAVDITARKAAEEALQASEAEFRAMFELAACGHVQADPFSGRYLRVNRQFCEMTGYSADELLRMSFSDITYPEDRQRDLEVYHKALHGETREWTFEKRYIRKDGRIIWVFVTGVLLRDSEGRPVRTTAIVLDITAEKAAREALRGSEERLRLILEQVPCLLWTTDDELRVTSFSGSRSVTGLDACAFLGSTLHEAVEGVACEPGAVAAHLHALVGEVAEYEATLTALGRTFAVRVEPLRNVEGLTVGTVAIGIEVTERKRVEHELRRLAHALEDRVAERTAELVQSYEALRRSERLAGIGEMVTALSHESRNDIQNSLYALEMLRRLAETPDQKRYAHRALEALDRLRRTYEGVRDYAAPIQLERASVSLDALWREAWDELAPQRQGRDARLAECCEGVNLRCDADAFRITQVFRNLMENALAACPDPVELLITCADAELDGRPALRVNLQDNGPGLPADGLPRIFDAFFTTKPKGTGLGLSIVRRIVEAHGGRIEASQPGGCGLELTFFLPR